MKRVLSSIGIGSATVDTVFPQTELVPGETVTAEVELYGGDATQEIDDIYFDLKTRLSEGDEERVITEFDIDKEIELSPGDERTVPVDIEIPPWAPLTRGGTSVWLETGLDIDWAVDPTDEDRIDIVPDEYIGALFDALDEMGFALRYAELVETPYLDDRPFAQELDFRPTDSRFTDDLDELEITLVPRSGDLRVFVEFDTVDEIADEYDMDFDEMEASLTFDRADADTIRRRLKNEIKQYS